ncbi:hypothetical protein BCR35DRAFT_300873 [Leucosporidium creatinivorum]|uniref:Inhibitor I9 domain-containing protein n=1 Tax=Leucosporidium creatinivorum TaxID=106004 RepID=A0A1Y2G2G9_9BASI|nr:hypothetical protein BCR35DRAFT_300873 [Leucosporidium creatinivorum]
MSLNNYIVVFKSEKDHAEATDDHISSLASKVESSGGSIKHRYEGRSLRGFAGSFSDDLKKELESSDTVKYVEADGEVTTQ